MKRLVLLLLVTALGTAPAFAETPHPPTYAELQGIAQAYAAQADTLRNLHVQAEAKAAALADENATLKKQIEELKKPVAGSQKEPPH